MAVFFLGMTPHSWLGGFLDSAWPNDLMTLIADHGNDPRYARDRLHARTDAAVPLAWRKAP